MQKLLVFLFLVTPHFSNAQFSQNLEKIVFDNGSVYLYTGSNSTEKEFKLLKISSNSIDTIFKYFLPDAGFEDNPICWDVINKNLITLPIYTDNQKFTNVKLSYYVIDSLIHLSKTPGNILKSYKRNKSRSMSSIIPPFDIYNNKIYYHHDTLRGRLFIDFTCSKDSFLFYIYIEHQKLLEKWQYTPFSRLLGFEKADEKPRQKSWVQNSKYDINLSGPFRTFAANNKNYLVTEDGRIMLIADDSIKEKGKIHDLEQKVLVFDKDRNKLLTIEKDLLSALKEPLSTEKIYQHSEVVIDFEN